MTATSTAERIGWVVTLFDVITTVNFAESIGNNRSFDFVTSRWISWVVNPGTPITTSSVCSALTRAIITPRFRWQKLLERNTNCALRPASAAVLNDFSVHFLVDFYWNEKKFFFVIKKSYLHKKSICVQCLSLSLHLKSNNHLSFNYVQEKRIVGGRKKTLFTDTTQECVSPQYTSLKFNFIFLP